MNISLDPSKPNISTTSATSRQISITWTINEIAYIQSFDIFKNNTFVKNINTSNPNDTTFYYNYTAGILPFRKQVKFHHLYF